MKVHFCIYDKRYNSKSVFCIYYLAKNLVQNATFILFFNALVQKSIEIIIINMIYFWCINLERPKAGKVNPAVFS